MNWNDQINVLINLKTVCKESDKGKQPVLLVSEWETYILPHTEKEEMKLQGRRDNKKWYNKTNLFTHMLPKAFWFLCFLSYFILVRQIRLDYWLLVWIILLLMHPQSKCSQILKKENSVWKKFIVGMAVLTPPILWRPPYTAYLPPFFFKFCPPPPPLPPPLLPPTSCCCQPPTPLLFLLSCFFDLMGDGATYVLFC